MKNIVSQGSQGVSFPGIGAKYKFLLLEGVMCPKKCHKAVLLDHCGWGRRGHKGEEDGGMGRPQSICILQVT